MRASSRVVAVGCTSWEKSDGVSQRNITAVQVAERGTFQRQAGRHTIKGERQGVFKKRSKRMENNKSGKVNWTWTAERLKVSSDRLTPTWDSVQLIAILPLGNLMGGRSPSSLDAAFLKELSLGFCWCYSLGFTNPFAFVMSISSCVINESK